MLLRTFVAYVFLLGSVVIPGLQGMPPKRRKLQKAYSQQASRLHEADVANGGVRDLFSFFQPVAQHLLWSEMFNGALRLGERCWRGPYQLMLDIARYNYGYPEDGT